MKENSVTKKVLMKIILGEISPLEDKDFLESDTDPVAVSAAMECRHTRQTQDINPITASFLKKSGRKHIPKIRKNPSAQNSL